MSLVKGHLRVGLATATGFGAAFLTSATGVFWLLCALGRVPATVLPNSLRAVVAIVVLSIAMISDLVDLRRGSGHSVLSWRRQTPRSIAHDFGARRAAIAWGFDAGLGFTTYRMTATFWSVVVLAICGFAPWWTGAAYAAGFLLPLALAWGAPLLSDDSARIRFIYFATSRNWRPRRLAVVLSLAGFLASVL